LAAVVGDGFVAALVRDVLVVVGVALVGVVVVAAAVGECTGDLMSLLGLLRQHEILGLLILFLFYWQERFAGVSTNKYQPSHVCLKPNY
jgi:hypothetical protein